MSRGRVDILFYSHDGRGYGHLSRTIAIALAVRRLKPMLRIMLVTGSKHVFDLSAGAGLDWIKLPSYRSVAYEGRSYRMKGESQLTHTEIVELRKEMLEYIVRQLNPRCVLVDHLPKGKDGELMRAIISSQSQKTVWILGLRAVVGNVEEIWSDESKRVLESHFSRILWYGSRVIHGSEEFERISSRFKVSTAETGFVSRAKELSLSLEAKIPPATESLTGTIGLSWQDKQTKHTIRSILSALKATDGQWKMFIGPDRSVKNSQCENISLPPNVSMERFGSDYLAALRVSGVAIAYAGYNSITDILWAQLPSILIVRESPEEEQLVHAQKIKKLVGQGVTFIFEKSLNFCNLATMINVQIGSRLPLFDPELLCGSEKAAGHLIDTVS